MGNLGCLRPGSAVFRLKAQNMLVCIHALCPRWQSQQLTDRREPGSQI